MNSTELLSLHDEMTKRCKDIMQRKNSDYTGGENATDALANFKAAATLGIHPVMGLLLRVQDKMKRIESFVADGKLRVVGETVQDACDDILNYSILAAALLKEEESQLTEGESRAEAPPYFLELPIGYRLCASTQLHHRPSHDTDEVLCYVGGVWEHFRHDVHPVFGQFALKDGSRWAAVNGVTFTV